MSGYAVNAVGGNAHVANFLGSSFQSANQLGLNVSFDNIVDLTVNALQSLTSPKPLINGVAEGQKFSVAAADHSAPFSPGAGGQNSSAAFRS